MQVTGGTCHGDRSRTYSTEVILPAERENIRVNVQIENIEICACDFQELREYEKKGAACVFFFFCR